MNQNIEQITLPLPEWLVNLVGANDSQQDRKEEREYAERDAQTSYEAMQSLMDDEDEEDTEVDEPEHVHITVLDPVLGETFEFCEDLPGVWTYSVDGVPKRMDIELGQVPVYGLFMPLGLPRVVQRLPRSY